MLTLAAAAVCTRGLPASRANTLIVSAPLQERLAMINDTLARYVKKLEERTTHHMG